MTRPDPHEIERRLADASRFARMAAHDVNNMLTSILGFADMCGPLLDPNGLPASYVGEITRSGNRGAEFARALWEFSHAGEARPVPTPVGPAVDRTIGQVRADHPTVTFTVDTPADLPPVAMIAENLQRVLGHLVRNAAQTVREGTVALTARVVRLTDADTHEYLGNIRPGECVEVRVDDTGPGIPPAVRPRLFVEPLFTTKVRHRGLGLAIVFRTLYAHAGGVRIDPPGPTGTTFRFVIPTVTAEKGPVPCRSTSTNR